MKNSNSKNYRKLLIIIFIFLAISLVLSFSGYAFFKNMQNKALRAEIFDGLKNSEIDFFTDNKFYSSLKERFNENDYSISSDINFTTTMENTMFSDLDLSKFNFNYDILKDNDNSISYHKLATKYGENDFLTIDLINEKNVLGIKSDEIVNRYVGIKKSNFEDVVNKVLDDDIDFSNAKKLKKYITERENIDLEKVAMYSNWEPYIEAIEANVNNQNVVKKENVIVTLEKDQVPTTEYTISFSAEQFKSILRKISSELEKNDEILYEFTASKEDENSENFQNNTQKKSNSVPIQIRAKETNYNATINIWGENNNEVQNQLAEQPTNNQEATNSAEENNSVVNQVETNTATNQNINNSIQLNETSNTTTDQPVNNVESNVVTVFDQPETIQQPTEQRVEEENSTPIEEPENTISQEDNFRIQGFISINENTEYVGDDDFIIGEDFEETIKNMSKFSKNLTWSSYLLTGAKANCTKSEMKEYLLNKLNEQMKISNTLIMKIFISQNKAVKLSLEIPETNQSYDIEIASKGSKEKYLNFKKLTGEDNDLNGRSVSIYKKNADNDNKLKINVNTIQQSKINNKVIIDVDTIGSSNSSKYTNKILVSVSDSEGEFKISTSNKIDFSNDIEIEELNNDNCLFMDELSNDDFSLTVDAIKDKIIQVLMQKNQNLQIIDTANSNTIIFSNDEE